MFDFLADTLNFFYGVWPSYGGSIALFTLAIMLVLSPLSIKSARGMIRMQRLQPELKKLQAQYKGDREALNREMMAFYQANNVNPFSSCLPLLLQMPVFIILYQVLNGLTRRNGETGTFDPKYLEPDAALRTALEGSRQMMSFGMDLSQSALNELQNEGLLVALPFFVLVALTVGSQFYQQRQIQGRNPQAASNPQQQMIMKIMPLAFIPITLSIPAGVVIYFVVSNAVRIAQQAVVTKLEYGEGRGGGAPIVTPKPQGPPPKGNGGTKPSGSKPTASGRVTPSGAANRNRSSNKRKRK
jgi:YidC/Oxa1 family membrane protein insertase